MLLQELTELLNVKSQKHTGLWIGVLDFAQIRGTHRSKRRSFRSYCKEVPNEGQQLYLATFATFVPSELTRPAQAAALYLLVHLLTFKMSPQGKSRPWTLPETSSH